jgi:F0F1-type ATP synthase membrane subunit b/b'
MMRVFGLILALVLVGSSKEIIVYNEETIVLICFAIFMLLAVKYMKNTAIESLESRADAIEKEFNDFYRVRENVIESLIQSYKKQTTVSHDLKMMHASSKKQIQSIFANHKMTLHNRLSLEIDSKLDRIFQKNIKVTGALQETIAATVTTHMYKHAKGLTSKHASSLSLFKKVL